MTTEEEYTLSYLSKEYHDLKDFRIAVKKELQRIGKCVSELAVKIDNVAKAIDEFQAYSYRYNIKIVGVPEKGTNESADETSGICVALFREMGADVSINDIDTAHRVPGRNNSSQDPRPKAIVCKFVVASQETKLWPNEPMPTKPILLPLASEITYPLRIKESYRF